ncbi:MAG TPA: LLM class flavin-dependent oxidoreductase [Acidimicrobiales bacterium]|nr:LLM class flavin-dependent oxidoreductase [Acidimicrobiales bacterium]
MKYGFVFPGGTALEQIELAEAADSHGWDGVFVWEAAYGVDAWSLLTAMAMRTTRVKLGTMLTPLPWRRPWKLASQVLTLDEVSGGRAILTVGLGAVDDALGTTDEVTDRRTRAELLDEGIDLIAGLWEGRLAYEGTHHRVDLTAREQLFPLPRPVSDPRPPIWVVGAWPRDRSMQRVLRCDGLVPNVFGENGIRTATPADLADMRAWLVEHGAPQVDIVMEGDTPADDAAGAADTVARWADAGATWWLESRWVLPEGETRDAVEVVRERLVAGPPRR